MQDHPYIANLDEVTNLYIARYYTPSGITGVLLADQEGRRIGPFFNDHTWNGYVEQNDLPTPLETIPATVRKSLLTLFEPDWKIGPYTFRPRTELIDIVKTTGGRRRRKRRNST